MQQENEARRERTAMRLICSEVGLEAAHEGSIGWLYDFCRKNERLPSPFEAERLKAETKARDAKLREMTQQPIPQQKHVYGFSTVGSGVGDTSVFIRAIQNRRARLAKHVFDWAVTHGQEAAE